MLSYTLPPEKAEKEPMEIPATRDDYTYPDEWARRITIPVNSEILQSLSVGGDVEVTLRGKVEELSENQSASDAGRTSMTISITSVDAESESEMAEEEAFETGFGRGKGYSPMDRY